MIFDSPLDMNLLLPKEQPLTNNNDRDERITLGPPPHSIKEKGESRKCKRPYKLEKLKSPCPPPESERKLQLLLNKELIKLPPMNRLVLYPKDAKVPHCTYHRILRHGTNECHAFQLISQNFHFDGNDFYQGIA